MASDTATQKVGRITQVIGSTFDAQFDDDNLPDIYNAVEIDLGENGILTAWSVDKTAVTPEHLSQYRLAMQLWEESSTCLANL